jgi:hypothetical protein
MEGASKRKRLWLPGGKSVDDIPDRVVRFMGSWACLDHYRIQVKNGKEIALRDLFPNRAARRSALRGASVRKA